MMMQPYPRRRPPVPVVSRRPPRVYRRPGPAPTEGFLDGLLSLPGQLLGGIFGGGGGGGGQQQPGAGGQQQQNPLGGLGPLLGQLAPIAGGLLGGPLGGLAGSAIGGLLPNLLGGAGGVGQQGIAGLLGGGAGGAANPFGAAVTAGGQLMGALPGMLGQVAPPNPQLTNITDTLARQQLQTQATAEHRSIEETNRRHREVMTALASLNSQVAGGAAPRRF